MNKSELKKKFNEMETNTKILLSILAVITLPITIPLSMIVIATLFGTLCFILGMIATYPVASLAVATVAGIVYWRLK